MDHIRGEFQTLIAEHQPATLTTDQQQAILDSTAKFVVLSVGDYLAFPDALENLKQRLRQAFDRRPLAEEQQRRLEEQREWIREFIRQLPLESGVWLRLHSEPLAEFEDMLNDPLWPVLKEPLSDEQFAVFQQKLKERQEPKIHFVISHIGAALAQTLWPKGNWSSSDGNVWFTLDRAHRGEQPRLPALDGEGQPGVLDVATMRVEYLPGRAPLKRAQIETLLKGRENQQGNALGDLGYFQKGDLLTGFRGARLALLDTNDWYTADQLSDRELQRRLDTSGADTIALAKHRPRGAGLVNPDAPFIAVRTGSGRLAVVAVQAFDSISVTIHIRTRPVDQGGTGADGGAVSNPANAAASPQVASSQKPPATNSGPQVGGVIADADSGQAAPELKKPKFVWGPITKGLRAAVEFVPQREVNAFGMQLGVRFHVENAGTERIRFTSETWRQGDRAIVRTEAGQEQPVTDVWYSGEPIMVQWTLKPGEQAMLDAVDLGIAENDEHARQFQHPVGQFLICPPGRYTIHYAIRFGSIESKAPDGTKTIPAEGDFSDTLETGGVPLVIQTVAKKADPALGSSP